MTELIHFFVALCLLRRTPQELPISSFLFGLTLTADLVTGLLVGLVSGANIGASLLEGLVELLLLLGLLAGALKVTGHPGRLNQSGTALMGTNALISLMAIVPLSLNPTGPESSDAAALGAFLLLGLIVWSLVVAGHIVRHTFDLSLGQGIAVAVVVQILTISLLNALFG